MAISPHYDYGLFRRAIAMSLLLHALLLLQPEVDALASHPSASQALMAILRVKANSSTIPERQNIPLESPSPSLPRLHALHAPQSVREVSSAATTEGNVAPVVSMPQSATETISPATAASARDNATNGAITAITTTVPSAVATTTATTEPELDFSEGKKAYLFAIAAEARRVKKYPPRAFAAGWTGTAEIRIEVVAGGNVQPPQLHKSSGYHDIDNAALSLVSSALKRTPVPGHLRGRDFAFVLPVSFVINDN